MDRAQAEAFARTLWGSRGFARELREATDADTYDSEGWRICSGPIFVYEVGYYRTGKKGAKLSTVKGRSPTGYAEAFEAAGIRVCP
jgi:hypothetical protein